MKVQLINLLLLFFIAIIHINVSSQIQYVVGSYTGDGNATKAITGVGFSPNLLIIKGDAAVPAIIATSSMTAGKSKDMSLTSTLLP